MTKVNYKFHFQLNSHTIPMTLQCQSSLWLLRIHNLTKYCRVSHTGRFTEIHHNVMLNSDVPEEYLLLLLLNITHFVEKMKEIL